MSQYKGVGTRIKQAFGKLGRALLAILMLTLLASLWGMLRTDVLVPDAPGLVNDVTGMNPIVTERVIAPTTLDDIVSSIRQHPGPISIGGGRYSMGGQTATEGALHIDMRHFNRILEFSPANKTITVQAGATWRQILEHIDPHNLSPQIMQTYSNFTVGGSLSVNVHGRYMGLGPLILSVRSIKVVLADGSVVEATPGKNREIFYGAIGGYGGLGVIAEVSLNLADNVKVARSNQVMPITEYKNYFFRNIRSSDTALFHNADIYPNTYETVNAVTYNVTDEPVTVPERLVPANDTYRTWHFLGWIIADWPGGKWVRRHIIDPILFSGRPVQWRNHEASYDVAELPASTASTAYVLQEYFVPVERFDEFVPKMRDILQRHHVNTINISIRHAKTDPGSLLAWARSEVFAFVHYYQQETDSAARDAVGVWTREMIDALISVGGAYYLPYQPHATAEQFHRAYPRAAEFFALKKRLDPHNKFRNKLWDKYYTPADTGQADYSQKLAAHKDYARDEGQTFLTHPEWYIVYSSEEFAAFLKDHSPTDFPYVRSIGQYWVNYRQAWRQTRDRYPFNGGYHAMLLVIGTSYSVELTLKGLYENTIGRVTGWLSSNDLSDEDRFAQRVAEDYGRFIHVRPWYEYRFADKLRALWADQPWWGHNVIRKWERKLILSAEYGFKAMYASLIAAGTQAAYDTEAERISMVVTGWNGGLAKSENLLQKAETLDSSHTLVSLPRYDVFRDILLRLARQPSSLQLIEIAGNREIFLTGIAGTGWTYTAKTGRVATLIPLPTDEHQSRVTLRVPVSQLLPVLRHLQAEGKLQIDHIYDY